MKFIGRKKQLMQLANIINSEQLNTTLIYGRRRVGKSELVKQAIKDAGVKVIYYECRQIAEASNVKNICDIVAEVFELPTLGYTTLEDIFEFIFKLSQKEKLVFVLDEYPYMRANSKGVDSILQVLIDSYKDSAKLSLILLGSFVDVMKSLLSSSNPLYGRVALTIDLKQMDYYESAMFYPKFSDEDKVRIYSVFGGIPYYNELIDDTKSVKENIINLIASPGARLENEVSMYLNSEISKMTNANEVFAALAQNYSKYSDILAQSHVSSGPTMADVLDRLIRMDVVERLAPINDERNKKKAGYYISDNLSLFYFRYIFRYSSQLKIMDEEVFYEKYIHKDFEEWFVPHRFEEICKQYLIRQNRLGNIEPVIEKIGKYYYDDPNNHTNGEFDVVTYDGKGYAFYEVKFRKRSVSKDIIEAEIQQVKKTGLDCYKYVFISREGFEVEPLRDVQLIELRELFS
ncbi:ATP-binding protein [Anaerovibrio lipolyticus]|uniref:ATP-binding protein n=1 Tax=Anaerovibrio lipolyticus TaxID=82374 RepID=UPI0026F27EEE|nr:ATP-binding protein [Anaerovibrio lipolyticus]MBE6106069.1 ATP-binding protein [Anaerovibrio lipolyticus]